MTDSIAGDRSGAPDPGPVELPARLRHSLTSSQLSMMGLGGAIGAGLFVGSGQSISVAGPAVLVSYAIAGVVVILVMAMLAEMSALNPESGAFSVFAEDAFGASTGATIGWLYWLELMVVIAAEATGAASVITSWVPSVPQWVWVLVFILAFTVVNLLAVAGYGRFEYWFAVLKVLAIVGFLVLGALKIMGVIHGAGSSGFGNLTAHGGFAPHGIHGIASGVLISIFAYGGTEVVAIAAAESDDPVRNVRRAVGNVIWRILVFYIGSMLVIVSILPWNDSQVVAGPFVAVLKVIGIPGVDTLMQAIVIVALLSALNANVYAASRMVFSLAGRGYTPRALSRLSAKGTPWVAVLASVSFGLVNVVFNALAPGRVLSLLLNVVGSTMIVVWTSVILSQIVLRRRSDRAGVRSPSRLPGFPGTSVLALVLIAAIIVLSCFSADTRNQLLATLGLCVALWLVMRLTIGRRPRGAAPADPFPTNPKDIPA